PFYLKECGIQAVDARGYFAAGPGKLPIIVDELVVVSQVLRSPFHPRNPLRREGHSEKRGTAAMKLYLIVAKGRHQGMPILIKVDLFLMGSEKICQLRSGLPGILPQHCAVVTRGNRVFVRNLGDGKTSVNGQAVPSGSEWPLHKDDRLVVGPL